MRDLIVPEVDRGTISAPELDALAGSYRDRRRFIKAAHGHREPPPGPPRDPRRHRPGREIARADGDDTPQVEFARQEVLRVRAA